MKKIIAILVVVIAVVAVGGNFYYQSRCTDLTSIISNTSGTTSQPAQMCNYNALSIENSGTTPVTVIPNNVDAELTYDGTDDHGFYSNSTVTIEPATSVQIPLIKSKVGNQVQFIFEAEDSADTEYTYQFIK